MIAAARRAGARFSVTARLTPTVVKAIASIAEDAWTPIRYPNAVFDEDQQRWISDAEVAEIGYTAFTSRRKYQARHRPADRAPGPTAQPGQHVPAGQTRELFAVYRHHAVFTNSPRADAGRRGRPPRPRDHRAGHRRPEERPARAPALGRVHRQRRLAGLRRDRPQPAPRRRHARRRPPRPDPHRHHPRPADQHPGPARALRPPPAPAPTPRLALGARPGRAVHRRALHDPHPAAA